MHNKFKPPPLAISYTVPAIPPSTYEVLCHDKELQASYVKAHNEYLKKAKFHFNDLIGVQDVYFNAFSSHDFRSKLLGNNRSVKSHHWTLPKSINDCYQFDLGKGLLFPSAHLIEHPTLFIKINPTQSSFLSSWFSNETKTITNLSSIIESTTLFVGNCEIDNINGNQLDFVLHKYQLKWTYHNGTLMLPLPFDLFWGKNAFAFSQLQHHHIHFDVKVNPVIIPNIKKIKLRMDHIMINNFKPKLATSGYEYILKQSQYITKPITSSDSKCDLPFKHPVTDFYFFFTDANNQVVTQPCFNEVSLMLDENTYETHDSDLLMSESPMPYLGIYAINFGQNETLNFSRVKKVILNFTNLIPIDGLKIHVGALSHNVGRQMSGMFGLAYSE